MIFNTWKPIRLGTYKSIPELREALSKGGFKIGNWADDILSKVSLSPEEREIELVTATIAELGFKDGARYCDIEKRIKGLGFDVCPAEVGPQLRLQYPDQPKDERNFITMNPISGSGGRLRRFCVGHDDGVLWLDGSLGHPGDFWTGDYRWVFLRRRK